MMKTVVRFFRRRAIICFLKRKKQCILPDITKYPTVALLLDEEQFKHHKEIEATVNRLFNLKRLTLIAHVHTLPKDVLQSDRHLFIQKEDYSFWGLMKQDKKESLTSLSFDMVVDFTPTPDDLLTRQYVLSLVNTTFRVTFGRRATKFYDMVIDAKKTDDIVNKIEILHVYLSMLFGKR